jgi:hypothetical protein
MRRRASWGPLTAAERIVIQASAGLVIDGVVPWWYRVKSLSGTYNYNAGLHGWGVLAVGAGALALIVLGIRSVIWPRRAPRREGALYAALGAVATGAVIVQVLRSDSGWIGLYVAIALGVWLLTGGARRIAESR